MTSEQKIIELLKSYSFVPVKIKENSEDKLPDYEVYKDNKLIFYCEVKCSEKDKWLDQKLENAVSGEIVGGLRSDPTFNRLTTHVHKATKQLISINPKHEIFNVIAFYNQDDTCDFWDLYAVITGNFLTDDGRIYPIYKNYSEGRIKKDIENIDLFIWLGEGKKTQFLFNFSMGVERVKELCNLFNYDIEKIKMR